MACMTRNVTTADVQNKEAGLGKGRRKVPRPEGSASTVRDVAAAAGVSVATVSRVLNGKATVARELRLKVEAVAANMAYTPHAAAKALASQRFMTIGAIVPTLEEPNFAVGVAALQKRLNAEGYTLLLASSNYDPEEEWRQIRAMCAQGIAGLMLVGSKRAPEVYELLHAKNLPYVNTWVLDKAHPCVGFDNEAIGRTVANYLLDLGHRQFGVISQLSINSDRAAGRLMGVKAALASRGFKLRQEKLIERSHKIEDGRIALREMLAAPKSRRPTAVICGTDTIAFGALVEAAAQGLVVPADISITGINDTEFSAHLQPPLTTIRLPVAEVGARAAEYLIDRIAHKPAVVHASVGFSLVARESAGRVPSG